MHFTIYICIMNNQHHYPQVTSYLYNVICIPFQNVFKSSLSNYLCFREISRIFTKIPFVKSYYDIYIIINVRQRWHSATGVIGQQTNRKGAFPLKRSEAEMCKNFPIIPQKRYYFVSMFIVILSPPAFFFMSLLRFIGLCVYGHTSYGLSVNTHNRNLQ